MHNRSCTVAADEPVFTDLALKERFSSLYIRPQEDGPNDILDSNLVDQWEEFGRQFLELRSASDKIQTLASKQADFFVYQDTILSNIRFSKCIFGNLETLKSF